MTSLVSDKDCALILNKSLNGEAFELVNFKTKPFFLKNSDSYALHFILEIDVKDGTKLKKHRFFIKKTPENGTHKFELVKSRKSFEKEELFYNTLLPILLKNDEVTTRFAPQIFLQKEKHILILEDLTMKFFIRAKRAYPIFLERIHLSLALHNLAKFHALSFNISEKELHDYLKKIDDINIRNKENHPTQNDLNLDLKDETVDQETTNEAVSLDQDEKLQEVQEDSAKVKWFKASVKGVKSLLLHGISNDSTRDKLSLKFDDYVLKCKSILETKTDFLKVLCHGQLHTKNILFKYEGLTPNQCVFVDFQEIMYFYPAYDVLLMIYLTTHQLFRQHYFTYLLKFFYDHFVQEISALNINIIFSYDEFLKSVNYVMPLVKLQAALYFQESTGSREFHAKLEHLPKIFKKYFFEDKSDVSLQLLRKDPNFRIIMSEVTNEIRELCNMPNIYREDCYKILEERIRTTVYDLLDYQIEKVKDEENIYWLEIHFSSEVEEAKIKYKVKCVDNIFKVLKSLS